MGKYVFYEERFGLRIENNQAHVLCVCGGVGTFPLPVNIGFELHDCPCCTEHWHVEISNMPDEYKNQANVDWSKVLCVTLIRPKTNAGIQVLTPGRKGCEDWKSIEGENDEQGGQ